MLRNIESEIREKCRQVSSENDTNRLLILIEELTKIFDQRDLILNDAAAASAKAASKRDNS